MHGFALNLRPDLDHFALIDPCGIGDLGVTSVEWEGGSAVDLQDVRAAVADQFGIVFNRAVRRAPPVLWELIGSWGLLEATPAGGEIRPIYS
jgi:lipoyl(octanoyl) transferase